jgi:hypothetical protein
MTRRQSRKALTTKNNMKLPKYNDFVIHNYQNAKGRPHLHPYQTQ